VGERERGKRRGIKRGGGREREREREGERVDQGVVLVVRGRDIFLLVVANFSI